MQETLMRQNGKGIMQGKGVDGGTQWALGYVSLKFREE